MHATYYFRTMDSLFPEGTRRRLVVRLFLQALTHPKEVLPNINWTNFRKFLSHFTHAEPAVLEEKISQKLSFASDKSGSGELFLQNSGYCNCCDTNVIFSSSSSWLRDFYFCSNCKSIPRERALMYSIEKYFPHWRDLSIHESSPCDRGASPKLQRECDHYVKSQYYPDKKPGEKVHDMVNINLEKQGFQSSSFDLVITQDVVEHIFHPEAAFREIARTLKTGGAHIFTVPLVNKDKPSQRRATLRNTGDVEFLFEPEYHGNPVDIRGSLVTMHWGYDICDYIYRSSGLFTTIAFIDNLEMGIRAEYIEVLISRKENLQEVSHADAGLSF